MAKSGMHSEKSSIFAVGIIYKQQDAATPS